MKKNRKKKSWRDKSLKPRHFLKSMKIRIFWRNPEVSIFFSHFFMNFINYFFAIFFFTEPCSVCKSSADMECSASEMLSFYRDYCARLKFKGDALWNVFCTLFGWLEQLFANI